MWRGGWCGRDGATARLGAGRGSRGRDRHVVHDRPRLPVRPREDRARVCARAAHARAADEVLPASGDRSRREFVRGRARRRDRRLRAGRAARPGTGARPSPTCTSRPRSAAAASGRHSSKRSPSTHAQRRPAACGPRRRTSTTPPSSSTSRTASTSAASTSPSTTPSSFPARSPSSSRAACSYPCAFCADPVTPRDRGLSPVHVRKAIQVEQAVCESGRTSVPDRSQGLSPGHGPESHGGTA